MVVGGGGRWAPSSSTPPTSSTCTWPRSPATPRPRITSRTASTRGDGHGALLEHQHVPGQEQSHQDDLETLGHGVPVIPVLQLAQPDGAEVQGPAQGLVHAQRALHEAPEPAAVPQAQEVTQLVARDLRETGPPPCSLEPAAHQNPGTPGEGHTLAERPTLGAWQHGGLDIKEARAQIPALPLESRVTGQSAWRL